MEAGLYIIGTPIGNLGDISARALEALREADRVVAEDTRRTRKLFSHYDIHTPLTSCHKFNEASRLGGILAKLDSGQSIGLVTDAGMPCISDPGSRLVSGCREAGFPITCIPGADAITTAMALSGYGGHAFMFAGFLSRKKGKRKKRLQELIRIEEALVIYESPYRLLKLVDAIEEVMGPEQELFVARELTKKFEETICGRPAEIRESFGTRKVKGECVVVISAERPALAAGD